MRKPLKAKPLKLKGVKRTKMILADGSVVEYFYHRATMTRLDPLNLVTSFAAAERAMRDPKKGTFSDLIRNFDSSKFFEGLAEATRESYLQRLKVIDAKWGTVPIAATQDREFRRDVLAWHEKMAKKSASVADNTVVTMAKVLSYAKEKAVIDNNVLDPIKRLYKADRSDMTWSDGLVTRFLGLASPPMVTAMFLGRNTGQRQKDIRELPWTAYDGTSIRLRTSKSGGKIFIDMPCPLELKQYLDRLTRVGKTILVSESGAPLKGRHFNRLWREASDAAEGGELNFHDLRGTAATKLAEAGATIPMIASLMGWSPRSAETIVSRYVARSSNLAKAGIELLEAHRARTNRAPVTPS